jgi:hypothetical protein
MYQIDPPAFEKIPSEERYALGENNKSKSDLLVEYMYTPLPSDKKRIRLLRLLPRTPETLQVICIMFEAEFVAGQKLAQAMGPDRESRDVKYEALSWRWSDEINSPFSIIVYSEDGKIYKKRVSETLILALIYLRGSTTDRVLWIDAICINQKDEEERSYQVSMMSLVYARARQVCVWLGEDDADTRKAFKFIREEISPLKDFGHLCDQSNAQKWRLFLSLIQREWFSRRWVVQEIALASKATVYCGRDELEWRELAMAVELFVEVETVTHRLDELSRNIANSGAAPNWIQHSSKLGANLLVNTTASIFREYQRGDDSVKGLTRRSLLSLEYLVTSMSTFGCGRPHDSVYALIAIARDASPIPPASFKQNRGQTLIAQLFEDQLEKKPYLLDYNSPYPDACKDFVQFCIERCAKRDPLQALDILCRPWAKHWQPGHSTMDESQKTRPVKESVIEREDGPWITVLHNDKETPFHFSNENVKELVVDSEVRPHRSGSPETSTPVQKAYERDHSELPPKQIPDEEDVQAGSHGCTPKLGGALDLEVLQHQKEQKRRTFIDNRSNKQWREQVGVVENLKLSVREFILNAFPKDKKDGQPTSLNSELVSSHQTKHEEHEWTPAEAVIESLGKDPKLKDIIHAKVELAKVDQVRAKRAKVNITPYRPPSNRRPIGKDGKPVHARIRELGLPSWVATINGSSFVFYRHPGMNMRKMGRANADPLVGAPQDGYRNYNAGLTKMVDVKTLKFRKRAQMGHYSLYLKGFCFDRVAKVSQVSQAGAIPATWLDLAGWPEARASTGLTANLGDPPTAFWRTLVADRGRNDRNPPYYYARACRETILKGIRRNAVDTTALISHEQNSIIADYCRRVQSVIWNRALIKTNKGALGLVSNEVREGDLICILYGCTVPVILRQESAKFKSQNESENEILEDGIEAMKRLIPQMERFRERKFHYSAMDAKERAEVKEHTFTYNKDHAVVKDTEKIEKLKMEAEELKAERKLWWGKVDTQSDIDSEDDVSDIDKDDARQDVPGEKQQLDEEEELKKISEDIAKKQRVKERHKERQRKAKIRDPLRHYRFLDQAYIHGMMDGEAVRQKFYNGKSDHVFEIR